nr:hypothetical protein [Rhizobium leguminosarum]
MTISVSLGILSDLIGDRRRIMVAMALMGVLAYGATLLFRCLQPCARSDPFSLHQKRAGVP